MERPRGDCPEKPVKWLFTPHDAAFASFSKGASTAGVFPLDKPSPHDTTDDSPDRRCPWRQEMTS